MADVFTPSQSGLAQVIRESFPAFRFSGLTLAARGDDHIVAFVDGAWVFRFPRTKDYRNFFGQQLRLLEQLRRRTAVPVPYYEYISRENGFGGYRMLQGEPAIAEYVSTRTDDQQNRFLRDMAGFLSALHGLERDLLENRIDKSPEEYSERYRKETRAVIETAVPARLLQRIDAFFMRFVALQSKSQKIIHGDLRDEHILLAATGHVTGIFDFGDVTVGDPAFDFAFFWRYGGRHVQYLYSYYEHQDDPSLLPRSHWYFVRYLVSELYYVITGSAFSDGAPTLIRLIQDNLALL